MYEIMVKPRSNSRYHSKSIAGMETIQEVKTYLNHHDLHTLPTPYVFTHIPLSDGSIVVQTVSGIICSPVSLAKALGL